MYAHNSIKKKCNSKMHILTKCFHTHVMTEKTELKDNIHILTILVFKMHISVLLMYSKQISKITFIKFWNAVINVLVINIYVCVCVCVQ